VPGALERGDLATAPGEASEIAVLSLSDALALVGVPSAKLSRAVMWGPAGMLVDPRSGLFVASAVRRAAT